MKNSNFNENKIFNQKKIRNYLLNKVYFYYFINQVYDM